MKTMTRWLLIGLVSGLGVSAYHTKADVSVSASVQISAVADFQAPLTPHGGWVEVGSYGRCWRPSSVAVGWRPYTEGHWVWTDAGWYWESDEPWGWACYHYGNWVYDGGVGWVWVPGIEWAPAWVSWRVGGGYYGWAPIGPRGIIVADTSFVFVEGRNFGRPIRHNTVIVNNTTIINKTTVINKTRTENRDFGGKSRRVVVNEGPRVEEVEKESGQKFTRVAVVEAAAKTEAKAPEEVRRPRPGSDKSGKDATAPAERSTKERPDAKKDATPTERPGGKKESPADQPGKTTPKTAPAERPTKETPAERPKKEVPSERPNKEVPSERKAPAEERKAPIVPSERPAPAPERPQPPVDRPQPPRVEPRPTSPQETPPRATPAQPAQPKKAPATPARPAQPPQRPDKDDKGKP